MKRKRNTQARNAWQARKRIGRPAQTYLRARDGSGVWVKFHSKTGVEL